MKLETKAKPVKIRVLSGGEEHSSLDSLKKNFCIKDVKALMDGRLSRWLKQQNEENLAEEIEKFNSKQLDSEAGCLNLIRIIFREELKEVKPPTLRSLAEHWYTKDNPYKQSGLQVYRHLQSNDVKAAIYVYKSGVFPDDNWVEIFQDLANNEKSNGEGYYILGELLLGRKNPKGFEYIIEAANLKHNKAINYLSNKPRFFNVNMEYIEELIKDFDKMRPYSRRQERSLFLKNPLYLEEVTQNAQNGNELTIINFLFDLKYILEGDSDNNILKKYENSIMKYEAIYLSAYLEALNVNKDCWLWWNTSNKISEETTKKLEKIRNVYKKADDFLEKRGLEYVAAGNNHTYPMHFNDKERVFIDCINSITNYSEISFNHNEQQSNK